MLIRELVFIQVNYGFYSTVNLFIIVSSEFQLDSLVKSCAGLFEKDSKEIWPIKNAT